MDITSSLSKRAGSAGVAEVEPFEEGSGVTVPVPEAELEHVIPTPREETIKHDGKRRGEKLGRFSPSEFLKVRVLVDKKLKWISKYEEQITELVVKIDRERSTIRELLEKVNRA